MRCAIYTRKSTEERLDMRYNSLDAQRDACLAYIESQKHNGWVPVKYELDDGGYSGGSIDRPALRRLIALVEDREIDVVVVHKVDRLSRSLVDFARLADLFDQHGVSFVSVTQNLDTSTSMGRLSLNVLLSFAQFEREIASERIREKIAASRRKGLWTGGTCPMGYRSINKSLMVDKDEARFVRWIFQRYLATKSVSVLRSELASSSSGEMRHRDLSRGALYTILRNPVYIGKLRLGGDFADAVHEPIIEDEVWKEARQILSENTRKGRRNFGDQSQALLLGRLFDRDGIAITRSKTFRHGKSYCYYVSMSLRREITQARIRIPCATLDEIVVHKVRTDLLGKRWLKTMVTSLAAHPDLVKRVLDLSLADVTASQLASGILSVTIEGSGARVTWGIKPILGKMGLDDPLLTDQVLQITAVLPSRRSSRSLRTNLRLSTDQEWRDHGRRWFSLIATGKAKSQSEIAAAEGISQSTVSRAIEQALRPQL
jgi:site-specific DNA recombinase